MLVALERALHLAAAMELDANLLVVKSRIPPLAPFAAVIGYVCHWAKVDAYQTKVHPSTIMSRELARECEFLLHVELPGLLKGRGAPRTSQRTWSP
ncbi:hypothetical protein PI125_g11354 [Phytophthora idaei]|nr:hypothetical protein PI125_g11354 [Phytophthora idaei]